MYCLLLVVKSCTFFKHYFATVKLFDECMYVNTMKAPNCESFLGNEGKVVKQEKNFTVNNKQHMV